MNRQTAFSYLRRLTVSNTDGSVDDSHIVHNTFRNVFVCVYTILHQTSLKNSALLQAFHVAADSSVATGGAQGDTRPYRRQAWPQDSCKSEIFWGWG